MDARTILRLPPVTAAAALVAQRLLSRGAVSSLPTTLAGAALGVAGVAVSVIGAREFRSAGTTIDPVAPAGASVLVTDGIYRRSRNPIYVGDVLVLLGHAVHRRSLAALVPAAGWVLLTDRLQIPAEEAALAERFGADYRDYVAVVPRWV